VLGFPLRRLKVARPTLAGWAAFVLVGIAAAAVLLWFFANALDDWAPNIGVEALAIAATIVIVERIVRHEARRRLLPRIESVIDGLRSELRDFLSGITVDYASTHLNTFRPLERDSLDFLDQWLAEKDAQDSCQWLSDPRRRSELPLVLHQGVRLGRALRAYRELDREVMEPELVRAIDDYIWHGWQHGLTMYELRDHAEPGSGFSLAEESVVRAARQFAEVLARHDPRGPLQLDDLTLSAMQEHSDNLRRGRWQWYRDQRSGSAPHA
jgi:hypothetical protein